jgi:hypothetical protein
VRLGTKGPAGQNAKRQIDDSPSRATDGVLQSTFNAASVLHLSSIVFSNKL